MKISIIVPVYNAEQYIAECIQSVIDQTVAEWELILVDDGSTDRSPQICDEYALKYNSQIKVFHKDNEGQYLTREFGIQQCNGDYVAFLDSDDVVDKDFVKVILDSIHKQETDIICFGFYIWDGQIVKEMKPVCDETMMFFQTQEQLKSVYSQILEGNLPGSMWSKVFRKSILEDCKINTSCVEDKRYGEDAFHAFQVMSYAKKITFLGNSLYYYRMNPNGASQGFSKRELDYFNTKYVFEVLQESLKKWNMDTKEYRNKLFARNFNETVYYMLRFYRNATTIKRKIKVIQYDWTKYLLDATLENILENEFVRKSSIKVWDAFQKRKYITIFLREKFKKVIGW